MNQCVVFAEQPRAAPGSANNLYILFMNSLWSFDSYKIKEQTKLQGLAFISDVMLVPRNDSKWFCFAESIQKPETTQ